MTATKIVNYTPEMTATVVEGFKAGKSVEELEAEANAVAEAEAEAAADKLKALIAEFVKNALAKENKAEAEADLLDVLNEVFLGKKKDAIEMLNSLAE